MPTSAAVAQRPVLSALDAPCGYVRLSHEERTQNPQALANQIERVRAVIGPDAPLYVDIKPRWARVRPEYEKMKAEIEAGNIRTVVVARPDRLGNSKHEGCARVYEWLHRKPSVVTKFLDFDLDLKSPAGRLLLKQLVTISEFELHMLSVRIRANKEVKMRRGQVTTQPPFGYARIGNAFVPDTFQRHCFLSQAPQGWSSGDPVDEGISNAELAQMMLQAVAEHGSYAAAVRQMEPFSLTVVPQRATLSRYAMDEEGIYRCVHPSFPPCVSSVRNWCFHPAYRGHIAIRRNWDASRMPGDDAKNSAQISGSSDDYQFFHENTHEPLIDEDTFKKILAIERRFKLSTNGYQASNRERDPFCGLLSCAECGLKLKIENRKSKGKGTEEKVYSYYRCANPKCTSMGLRVATSKLLGMLARRLARIARDVQAGTRVAPSLDEATLARIEKIDEVVLKMRQMGDPYFDDAIQKALAERRVLAQEPGEDDELSGTGWQMLQQPKACNDSDWFVFLSRSDTSLHAFIQKIVVGYATPQDRPTKAPTGGGRRTAAQAGNPSILDVEPL